MNGPIHRDYNQSTLDEFDYQIFPNGTLSNGTKCFLSFGAYKPVIHWNGTFDNATACDSPYYSIASRGAVGLTWGIVMVVLIPLTMFCLRKHGAVYLQEKKKFRTFSRKWPWYWLLILQALCALAGFFSIDLDRAYIQGGGLTAYGAIFCATLPVSLGVCWELTRHWGSFEERKLDDEDPFRFRVDDTRSKVHLVMPMIFYLFGFMTFFMTVLRNWNRVKSADIEDAIDNRWKSGGAFAILALIQILAQIAVTRYYYKVPRVPLVVPAVIVCCTALIAFHITYMWGDPNYSPFNVHSSIPFVGLLGYLPTFLIVVLMILSGLARENEDKVIDSLRKERDRVNMAALMEQQRQVDEARRWPREEDPNMVDDKTVRQVVVTEMGSESSLSDNGYSEDSAQKQGWFFRFFGVARSKGYSWLSHNLKYIPFTSSNREDKTSRKEGAIWSKLKHTSTAPSGSTKASTCQRPPPRDIRENWKVKTVTGV